MRGRLCSRGLCLGRLPFMHGGCCRPCCRLWSQLPSLGLGCSCCPWGCVVVCVLHIVVRGWGLFTGGVRRSWLGADVWAVVVVHVWGGGGRGPLMWGGRCFVMVSLPRRPVCKVAPISGCERRQWRRAVCTYLNELDGDDVLSPSR